LIRQHRDNIIVVKPDGRLKKYDVPVYLTSDGRYIMHRVIEVHDDHYIIMGDNLLKREYVTDDMICGKLVGFYRKGKKYIDCENSRLYRLYSKIWVALIPVRPVIVHTHNFLGRVKRKFVKK
ncbi:MAG: S24/S26 family peptidase, partial [Eubacterium sp.]